MPNHVPLSTSMIDAAKPSRRLVMPPPMVALVREAVRLGYELPDVEEGDVTGGNGRVYPAMKVTLGGSEHRQTVEAVCRVVNGPEPYRDRVRWAARSALAEALRLASTPEAARQGEAD